MKTLIKYSMVLLCFLVLLYLCAASYAWFRIWDFEKKVSALSSIQPIQNEKEELLRFNNYDIHYFVNGSKNSETIIFLHPAFGDHTCFDKQINALSGKFRIITIDMIGFGRSQPDGAENKFDITAEHIYKIMQKESVTQASIAGVSVGALVAQDFAFRYPEMVRSLILTGGYDIIQNNNELNKLQQKQVFKWIGMAILPLNYFKLSVAEMSLEGLGNQAMFYKGMNNMTRNTFRIMSGLGNILRQGLKVTRNYPIALLMGEKDLAIALKYNKEWHEREPESEFFIIENAGHNANIENPEKYNQQVEDFITRKLK